MAEKLRKKQRRDQRRTDPASVRLTERDIDIVEDVNRYRVLSQKQIQLLHFGVPNRTAAERRLRKLYDHQYLERKMLPTYYGDGSPPILYILDRRGAELLRAQRGYDDLVFREKSKKLGHEFFPHALAINDLMVAVRLACRGTEYELEEWRTENQIKASYDRVNVTTASGKRESVPVVPDSTFSIVANKRRYPFLLELDRGTMSIKRFKRTKIAAYQSYHKTGKYEQRYGTPAIRVLTVTLDGKRMQRLKRATEEIAKERWFWFASLPTLTPEAVLGKPVWYPAGGDQARELITLR